MPDTYLALTIGPIYKTMAQARRTRHLWGASYLFSYIMKQLLHELIDEQKVLPEDDILIPHSSEELRNGKEHYGTGLFPDRLIAIANNPENIKNAVQAAERKIITLFDNKTGNRHRTFFENYFRVSFTFFELPDAGLKPFADEPDNENIVKVANRLLDTLELKEKYHNDISDIDWKQVIDDLNGKLLYKDAFAGVTDDYIFPFLAEIATADFEKNNGAVYKELVKTHLWDKTRSGTAKSEEDAQQQFLEALGRQAMDNDQPFNRVRLMAYHKYIAVVQADGDNIGATIGKIGNNPGKIKEFSKALGAFAIAATTAVENYGGKSVYIGGDDLLFFAPVAVNDNENGVRTIFGLIEQLDDHFKKNVIENDSLNQLYGEKDKNGNYLVPEPSLSYGISIIYSKFPLNEARNTAYHLMQQAKSIKDDKNKICFKLLKHSGHGLGFIVDKKMATGNWNAPLSYDTFMNLTNRVPLEKNFLSSIIYKLHPIRLLLNEAAQKPLALEALFDNTFNEPVHKQAGIKRYLDNIRAFIYQLYQDFPHDTEDIPAYETEERKSNLQKIYSTLRFVQFVTTDYNE